MAGLVFHETRFNNNVKRSVGTLGQTIIVDINSSFVQTCAMCNMQGQVVSQDVLDDITEGGGSWLPNSSLKFVAAKLSGAVRL